VILALIMLLFGQPIAVNFSVANLSILERFVVMLDALKLVVPVWHALFVVMQLEAVSKA